MASYDFHSHHTLTIYNSISQAHRTTGLRLAGIADLSRERAIASLKRVSFPEEKCDLTATISLSEGIKTDKTAITTDSAKLIATPEIDVILEATGNPAAGIRHALLVRKMIYETKNGG